MANANLSIFPYFTEEGIDVDLYKKPTDEEPIGGATFSFDHLVEQLINEFAEDGEKIDSEEGAELAYKVIDALRNAANKLAEAVNDPEEDLA